MLLATALMLAGPEAKLDQLIEEWCNVRAPKNVEICVDRQRLALKQFFAARAVVREKTRVTEIACLKRSATEPSVNWIKAASCMEWRARRNYAGNLNDPIFRNVQGQPFANAGWVSTRPSHTW